jgi:hypothetical protein
MYTDPNGELVWFAPLIAIAVSAAISAASYTIQVACSPGGMSNWNGMNFFAATFMGAWSGAATAGIGGVIGGVSMSTATGVLKELGRAGAHAAVGGLTNMASGGTFWQGAATGAISSFTGSLTHNLPIAAQIGASTIAGGVTSKISGGEFWKGAVTGFTVSAFNHALDGIQNGIVKHKFFNRLRKHYEGGTGADFILTESELNYLVRNGKINHSKAEAIGEGLFRAPINFYKSGFDLKYSFGEASVFYTMEKGRYNFLDLNDTYNFNSQPWGEGRSYPNEIITRAYNWWSNGKSFNIYHNKFYLGL